MSVSIITGDCRDVLPSLEDGSVNCCVTSPPYWGLRDYGCDGQLGLEPTPKEYVDRLVGVFREVRRVLRSDGTLWLNLGDTYVRNGGPRGKSLSSSGIVSYPALLAGQAGGRYSAPAAIGLRRKNLIGIPWRVAFALQEDGWILRTEIIWHKPNAIPESVPDRPSRVHEYIFLLSKSERYFYDAESLKEEASGTARHRGQGVNPKAKAAPEGVKQNESFSSAVSGVVSKRNKRSVWRVHTHPYPEEHYATFPPKLAQPCILGGCPLGGTVLDPFAGSGTVGEVSEVLGRDSVLIELSPESVELANKRTRQLGLFTRRTDG